MTISVELTFEQIARAVRQLKPAEQETLAIVLDKSLHRTINVRRKRLIRDRTQGKLLTEQRLS
jgi:hypothetical protein